MIAKNISKPIAIVLGGTMPHIMLIEQLRQRGYYVILADYLDNPPAKQYADEHIVISTLDKEAVLTLAKGRKASAVLCTCIDQANVTSSYVSEQLHLPHPYSYETALSVTDKRKMKEIMCSNNIPTSKYIEIRSFSEVNVAGMHFPLIIKPADSNSANGVKKVQDLQELEEYLPFALKKSRNGYAIIEEFIEGVEISAYSYVSNAKAKLLMVQERLSVIDGDENVIKCYSSIAPARISAEQMRQAEDILTQIAMAFHLDNTPLFFQGIVSKDGISVIEFGARVGGGISALTIKLATGFDIIQSSIQSVLGEKVSMDSWHPMKEMFAVNQIYGKDGIFDHLENVQELVDDGTIEAVKPLKNKGTVISECSASLGRIAMLLFKGQDEQELRKKVRKTFAIIDAINENGESMIRRDLNFDNLWDIVPLLQ